MNFRNLFTKKISKIVNLPALLTLLISGLFTFQIHAQAPNVTYKGPLVITKGGTYTGNYASYNTKVPAISINTSEPVIIEKAIIKSAGVLIYAVNRGANVTIRNVKGYGLKPTIDNKPRGRFFSGYNFKKAIIENNYMENTTGIYLEYYTGSKTASQTIKVRYNKAKNIDGRYRNGGNAAVHFLVLNKIKRVKNVEIAWNEIINKPRESAVEDNINMHLSSGTSDSPISIHDNYIQGAYPLNLSKGYAGGGIMLADGAKADASTASAYVRAFNNHIVSTTNYGIAIAGGHNNLIYNNRVISSGYVATSSGTVYLPAQNVGIYILNVTNSSVFYSNTARDNYVGWVNKEVYKDRSDYYLKHGVNCTNNKSFTSSITMQMEKDEYTRWLSKVKSAGKKIGPTTSTTSSPSPAPITSGTVRVEAEKYTELADPGSQPIGVSSSSTHSAGKSVKIFNAGDKIRISFNANAGNYIIRARVRSGYYNSSSANNKAYWPGGYGFSVNGVTKTFTGNTSTISGKDPSYGGSYWGTMNSTTLTLKSGTNTVDIAAKIGWLGVDFIEIVPSSSSTSKTSEEEAPLSMSAETMRIEGENYKELADPGRNGIRSLSSSTHSNRAFARILDIGDKIRISFNASAGNYIIRARVRSGYANNKSAYWPKGYGFWVNGSGKTFSGNTATITEKDPALGGSYWGTMSSTTVSLRSGTNTVDIAAKAQWLAVDFIEIIPVNSNQRLITDEVNVFKDTKEFALYPNPVKDRLTIEGDLDSRTEVSIWNSSGEPVVSSEEVDSFDKKAVFDIQKYNMEKGIYFIKVRSGSEIFERKIVKE